jgi:zinc protease
MTVVRNVFEMGENDPMTILYQRMLSTAFLWHNYGFSTIGNRSDIERVPAGNLRRFYKTYYQPDNAMLVVAGKFEPSDALALIETHFAPIPRPDRLLERTWTEEPAQDGPRQVALKRVGDVAAAGLVYHIPAGPHEDYAPVAVLQEFLTGQPGGRLYKGLVETGELAGIDGVSFACAEPGVSLMLGQVAPGHDPDTVLAKMYDLVESSVEAVNAEEVERIKTRLLKDIKLSLTDSGQIGIELSEWAAQGDWRLFFIHRDRLKAVTPEDVTRVAGAYLLESNRTSGVFYPTPEPLRATIPAVPDVAKIAEGYTGTESIAQGEAFESTPEAIEARTKRSTLLPGVKLAVLSKKTRGESIRLVLRFHFGDEASLTPWVEECDFIPALLMRGTTSLDYQALQDRIDYLQSKISFEGAAGLLEATVETDRSNLTEVLGLLGEILQRPAFDASEFEVVKRELQAGLEEGLSDPQTLAMKAMSRATRPFPAESIHYVPTQEEALARLNGVTIARIRECYGAFYGASHGEIAAVGDVDETVLRDTLSPVLSAWPSPRPYTRIARPYLPSRSGLETILTPDKKMAIVTRAVAFTLTDSDPAFPAFEFGTYMLGQSAKSRLLTRLRHEGGLSYSAGAFSRVSAVDPGATLASYAICAPENARKALEVMTTEMERWLKEGLDATELAEGQGSYALQLSNELADDAFVARTLAQGLEIDRTLTHKGDLVKAIQNLDLATVKVTLQALLGDKSFHEVLAGDLQGSD